MYSKDLIDTVPITETTDRNAFFSLSNIAFLLISSILIVITFKDFLTAYPFFLPIKIRGIDDFFNVCLIALLVLHVSLFRIKKDNIKVLIFLSAILLFSIIQSILLKRSFLLNNPVFLMRDSFWFIAVYYFISISDRKYLDRYKKIALLFIWIQIAVFLFQQAYTIVIHRTILFEDDVNGSLGANMAHVLSYTLVLFIPLLYRYRNYFVIAVCTSMVLLASARSCMVITFFAMIAAFSIRMKPSRSIPMILLVLFTGAGVSYIYSNFTQTTLKLSNLIKQQNKSIDSGVVKGANRIAFLKYTVDELNSNHRLPLGFGIASYVSRTGMKIGGFKYKELETKFIYFNNMVTSGSTYNVWLGEMGIAGTIILVALFLSFVIPAWKDPLMLGALLAGFLGLLPQKLMESYAFGFFFWYLSGFYTREIRLRFLKDE